MPGSCLFAVGVEVCVFFPELGLTSSDKTDEILLCVRRGRERQLGNQNSSRRGSKRCLC